MPDQSELGPAEMESVEAILRELTAEDRERHEPPSDLWELIEAEALGEAEAESTQTTPNEPADVVPLRRWIDRKTALSFVAAAAAAVVVVVGVAFGFGGGGEETTVLARASLSYDPAAFDSLGADATAEVALVDADGDRRIEIERSQLPAPTGEDADLEIWLIEPDDEGNVAGIVSLGLVDPRDPGSFNVPEGYDTDRFFVVDISVEPHDGDPNHSGRSILRGALASV